MFQKKTVSLWLLTLALGQVEEGEGFKAKGKKIRLKTEVFSTNETL